LMAVGKSRQMAILITALRRSCPRPRATRQQEGAERLFLDTLQSFASRPRSGERPVRALQLGELRFMGAPRPLELLAVGPQSLDLRGVHRAFDIELCPAGIDLTKRFSDLPPLGGGPGLELGLLLLQGGALDLEIAELLGGRLCLIARGDDLG
jgi:hypothetical protein